MNVPKKGLLKPELVGKYLGERLLQFRHEKGWTLGECAAAINVAKSHLSQIERGVRLPSMKTLIDVAEQLEIRVCDLFVHEAYGFDEEGYDEQRREQRRERFPY